MRAPLTAARAALAALVLLLPLSLVAAEFKLPEADATPAELVNAALKSELDGPSEVRRSLLDRALKLDPNYAPARWQSGFVRYDVEWLTLEEVAKRVADDKQLAEYRKRRDELIDRAEDHRELARWCARHRLHGIESVHWMKVLEFDPQDAEALRSLGVEFFEGQLLTKDELAEAKKLAGQRAQAMKRWHAQAVKWRNAIDSGSGTKYEQAQAALSELTDCDAIPSLEMAFAENGTGNKADASNRVLIKTLGRMSSAEATRVLLRLAVVPDSETVREAASAQLRERPLHTYVPQLLSLMPEKVDVETRFEVYMNPSLAGVHEHAVVVRSGNRVMRFFGKTLLTNAKQELLGANGYLPSSKIDSLRMGRIREKMAEAVAVENHARAIQEKNDRARALASERIRFVLQRTTEFDLSNGYDNWRDQWDKYREVYSRELPGMGLEGQANYLYYEWRNVSCFPAGTPVITASGVAPIERIRVGDQVLAQDPITGEIAPATIQGTTLRPAAPLVKLTLGSKTLTATRGHPFWVNGQGWTMAKHLKVGQILHGIDGAVRIDAIEEAPAREAYNLVVGDYGTYFVGETPVLVHDNTPITETNTVVPGLELAATP